MAMKRCPVCGERYSDTYKNCPFCEEEEYWEDEQQETARRPILREGVRSSGRGGRSPYSVVTPILIVLILLMAALLIYLLYGDKIAEKFSKDPPDDSGKTDITTPVAPPTDPENTPAKDPGDVSPEGGDPDGSGTPGTEGPDTMPEGGGDTGTTPSGSGGMSYASAAALPGGLTLSSTDFTRPVSAGPHQLKVSGGTGTYTWISEDTAIATVSNDGTVTPVARGVTNVLVTDGSKKAVCIVRVTGGSAPASGGSGGTSSGTTSSGTSGGTTSSGGTSSGGTTAPSGGGSLKAGKAVVVNGGNGVRVRSGPSTNHDILASIPNGGSVNIVASAGDGWYEITFSNVGGVTTTGYMKGEFLANAAGT